MGTFGRVLAIIGAAVGIASVLLSIFLPELVGWYRLELDLPSIPLEGEIFLTGFGAMESDLPVSSEIATLVMIGGILIIVGAALCIVGAFTEKKPLGIIGGIVMIVGPLLLLVDLLMAASDFAEAIDNLVTASDGNIFFDSFTDPIGDSATWGLYTGFFVVIAGGVIGLVGGAIV